MGCRCSAGTVVDAVVVFSLFVEKLPTHRDYQKCSIPERQVIMKVTHTKTQAHTSPHLLYFSFVMLTMRQWRRCVSIETPGSGVSAQRRAAAAPPGEIFPRARRVRQSAGERGRIQLCSGDFALDVKIILTSKSLHSRSHKFLSDMVARCSPSGSLRSSEALRDMVRSLFTAIPPPPFPCLWNTLPEELRSSVDIE